MLDWLGSKENFFQAAGQGIGKKSFPKVSPLTSFQRTQLDENSGSRRSDGLASTQPGRLSSAVATSRTLTLKKKGRTAIQEGNLDN